MAVIYVARSNTLSKWGAEVGVGKHLFKVGISEEPPEAGWAGFADWVIVAQQPVAAVAESAVLDRLKSKEKMLDPTYYPKLKGTAGVFKVSPTNVENHILVTEALSGGLTREIKLKPADFAAYLIKNSGAV